MITILAILATVGFLSLSGYSDDARTATVKANVRTVYSAILTESTTSGNSPRWYVSHDPERALPDGSFAFIAKKPVALAGGNYGDGPAYANYSAGAPRWDRLRLNPDKFKISSTFSPSSWEALAANGSGTVTVGAVDVVNGVTAAGRKRSISVFQISAILPQNGTVYTTGDFSTPSEEERTLGGITGLVAAPGRLTALVSEAVPVPPIPAFVPGTAYSSGQTFSFQTAGWPVVVTVSSNSGNGTGTGTASSRYAPGVPDVVIWTGSTVQIWAAVNEGASESYSGQAMTNCAGATENCNPELFTSLGGYYQFGKKSGEEPWVPWWSTAPDAWGVPLENSTGATWSGSSPENRSLMRGPCTPGYHVPTAAEWGIATHIATGSNPGTDITDPGKSGTFASLLRLPFAWLRMNGSGGYSYQGEYGFYASSSPNDSGWYFMRIRTSEVLPIAWSSHRPYGFSLRCLRD